VADHVADAAAPARHRLRWARVAAVVIGAALAIALPAAAAAGTSDEGPATARPTTDVEPIEPIEPIATIPPIETGDDATITGPTLPQFGPALPGGGATADDTGTGTTIGIGLPDVTSKPSNAVVIILVLSVLSIAPSVLVLMTSFTRIVIVLSLTRNALGIPQLPPQQVIVGLSLFLTMFVMGPTLSELNDVALQPLLNEQVSFTEAAKAAETPMRDFMLEYTREPELELFLDASGTETPVIRDEVPLTALVPAFVLSELKSAFILGFMIMIPFLVIDLVVSAVLTSLGMMMLPPTFVSLPLKILLFVLLDGWVLVTGTLLESYA
jgi:flagellar biosynthesis protein FliP